MAGASTVLETRFINYLKGTAPATIAGLFVGLYNGDPTDAGTGGAEVTTTIRTAGRVTVALGTVSGSPANASNSAIVDFGNAAGATTITHFAVFDAATGGNMLFSAPLTGGSQAIAQGNAVSFAVGALTVTAS